MPLNNLITFRKGSGSEWTTGNPILASGEPGYDLTNNILKIGDGVSNWNNLPILFSGIYLQNIIEDTSPQLGNSLDINSYSITGIGNINISGNFIAQTGSLNQLKFNTDLDDPGDLLAGQLQWNETEGTLDLGLNDNYAMHLGEEMLYRVRNVTGSTLLAGQPVYASGLSPGANNRIEVNLYVADGSTREIRFMGLMTEDTPDNGNNGFATWFGYIRGVDTRGNAAVYGTTNKLWSSGEPEWNQGDILYVHPTVAGKLTKIEPKHSISVAIITDSAQNGKIFVRPTSYGHLDDNHDVAVSGATNGQFLQYNSVTDYWVPSSSGNFSTLQINGTAVPTGTGSSNYLTKWTTTNGLNNSIIYDNGTNIGIGTTSPTFKLDVVGSGAFTGNVSVSGKITHPALTGTNDFIIYSQGDDTIIGAKAGNTVRIRAGGNDTSYETIISSSYMFIGGNRIRLNSTESIINEFGGDYNFRVEGDSDENLLFLDAGTDRFGIGTGTPLYKLDVNGTGNFSQNLLVNSTPVSVSGHTHTSSNITDFNSSVSGVIDNYNIVQILASKIITGYEILSTNKTVFDITDGYIIGTLSVYYNGLKLLDGIDYTANNGSSFSLSEAGDIGHTVSWQGFKN